MRIFFKNFAIIFISLGLAGLPAEALYRAFKVNLYKRACSKPTTDGDIYMLQPGQGFVYSLRPFLNRDHVRGRKETPWSFTTNSHGFRGPEIGRKQQGSERLLILGDSNTFGWAESYKKTFPYLLSKKTGTGALIEVINAGIPGYNTVQEFSLLREIHDKILPDKVILVFSTNDAEPQHTVPSDPHEIYRFVPSWLWEDLKEAVNQNLLPGDPLPVYQYRHSADYLAQFEFNRHKREECRKAMDQMAAFCQSRKIPFYVFIPPDFNETIDASYRAASIHKQVSEWGRDSGFKVTDLLPEFLGLQREDLRVAGDGHPNAKAHELIANRIHEVLLADK
ncbi:MAG: SGNH/GDSL hydrolase family protein [Candidatus Omnitrophica bacterium]|nr:SGNH/GDSL hydrolase family protein [Candidatus Omnitrophota bacterium]